MRHFLPRRSLLPLVCASALVALPAHANADDSSAGDNWQYAASVYLWGAGITGATATGGEVDISFDTLISNLNMAFMGAFEARKSEWSLLADVVYLNVGDNGAGRVPVTTESDTTLPLKVDTGVKVKGWVLSFLGGYNLRDTEQVSLDVIAGARYLDLSLDFDLGLQSERFGRPIDVSASDGVWDAVVGVRGHANLNQQWYLPYHLDVGTGQSDLTWQAAAGVGYRFSWGDVNLVYRHMEWDFKSSSAIDDMTFSGPLLAAKFHF
ncbi:MAG: hypothetical protein U9Q81_04805 [Pseudomonadota bacterium]|nr:hypothetical protein [Pseudomonadota bacterium]